MQPPIPKPLAAPPLMNANTIAPVIKRIALGVTPEVAFNAYVHEMGAWWPVQTFSTSLSTKTTLRVDGQANGRVVELSPSGRVHLWGTILAYAKPLVFGHSWHPGNSRGLATIVHITFEPSGDGGTHLLLMHSGWEARTRSFSAAHDAKGGTKGSTQGGTQGGTQATAKKDAKEIRQQYDAGWNEVLACFARHVGKLDIIEL